MGRLQVTLACGEYELTRPLITGEIQPDGIEFIPLTMKSPERHWRMIRHQEFDVCEFSLAQFFMVKAQELPLAGIPVFPHRRFRHGYVFINTKAGIRGPKDLEGKRVGQRIFQNTAALWMRGILEHYYGVSLKAIQWINQDEEPLPLQAGDGLKIQRVPSGDNLDDMLVRGDVEAVIYPDHLPSFQKRNPAVGRLFPDVKNEEMKYYQDTGIFPIMHTVVIKQSLLDRYPWAARSLYHAFLEAKEICYRRMEDPRKIALAWMEELLEEQKRIMGKDPYAYGMDEKNRKNVETLCQYAQEQGMISRKLEPGELFVESILEQVPKYL
jgi:4,5-dihydroxyphthalate decarboxylase